MTRRSVLSEAAELLADLVGEGVRTICFLRSRRGIELIQRFARTRLEELGPPAARRADRPLPGRLHAPAAPRDRGPAGGRRAARGGRHRRARAGHRHRGAGRGDLRHLPRHGREPAADVGAGGQAQRGARAVRRRRGRAGPVLLPPSGGVPGAAGGGGDPRSRERADPARAPARRGLRGCRSRMPTRRCSASAGGSAPTPWSRSASCGAVARGATCRAARGFRPATSRCARRRRTRSRSSSAGSGELLGAVEAERAFTTVHPGAVYLHLGRSYEVRELDIEARRAVVDPFDGDWYTQPKKETEVYIERIVAKSDDPVGGGRGHRAVLRRGLGHRAGDGLPAQAALRSPGDRHGGAGAAGDQLPDPGALVRARRRARRPGGASARGPAGRAPRHRARPDRGAAAARDVRPLGHRRPVDQRPLPDRPADDLHLRRLSGRGGDRAARLRAVRAPGRRRREADRRVPLRRRLSVVRPEPQVRQPQRAAAQAGRAWS